MYFVWGPPKIRFRYEKMRPFRFSPVLPPHTFCMGATGFEHARVTSVESPNGLGGRSLAATPPLRGGRHRNRRGVSRGGAGGGGGGSRAVQHVSGRLLRSCGSHILYGDDGFFYFFVVVLQTKQKIQYLMVHFCVPKGEDCWWKVYH